MEKIEIHSNGQVHAKAIGDLNDDLPEHEISANLLLAQKVEKLPTLVEPLLPKVGLAALVGGSDTGKSSALRHAAIEICLGSNTLWGHPIHSVHQSAIYASSEDDALAVSYLLNKFNKARNKSEDSYRNLRFIFETEGLSEKLQKSLSYKPADIVIVDAFGDVFSGDIKDSQKVRECLNTYSAIAKKFQCLILFLHHTGKGREANGPSKNNILGSQAFEAKMRVVLELRQDPEIDTLRHLCLVKGNYLPSSLKNESIALEFDNSLSFTRVNESKPFVDLVKSEESNATKLSSTKLIPFLAKILDGKELSSNTLTTLIMEEFGVTNKTVYAGLAPLLKYSTPILIGQSIYKLQKKAGQRNTKMYSLARPE